jgi:hypothetical protein
MCQDLVICSVKTSFPCQGAWVSSFTQLDPFREAGASLAASTDFVVQSDDKFFISNSKQVNYYGREDHGSHTLTSDVIVLEVPGCELEGRLRFSQASEGAPVFVSFVDSSLMLVPSGKLALLHLHTPCEGMR